jgi:hypothetical protein
MCLLNGQRWFAGYADEPTIWHNDQGRITGDTAAFTLAFGVLDGKQSVEISEWTYEQPATLPARKRLD